ncbi:calcium-dependent phosphotriesterase [Lophiostoma macrostomum CBS 122681]|uniref:Calcium-dependent phosphotriesterase n=1 Tax=Lophiostoma macrostomum CBS 122681 TaxID=1314788 RepID=A0A6A6SV78_9PLEO|nr:calcium-dependent phosphotriesterase [Lophiostoma macrostomum CBS 122681]
MARTALYLLLLAAIAPYLYDRYVSVSNMLANRPSKFTPIYNIKSHEFKFQDRLKNCEDVLLDEGSGLAILSCDPGRDRWNTVMGVFARAKGHRSGQLYLWDYSTPNLPSTEALRPIVLENFPHGDDFHPLGIEYDASTSTLYVISHMLPHSVIEIFSLAPTTATATYLKTFQHDLIHAPNSIHTVGAGKLYVTIDHYFQARTWPLLSKIETFAGPPLAGVIFVDINEPASARYVARVPFANGIAGINETSVVVASSSKSGLYFYTRDPVTQDLRYERLVRTPAAVDNISVDRQGRVLAAGHPYALELVATAEGREGCVEGSLEEGEQRACGCAAPSWAAEWSEEAGLRVLYMGREFCTSSSVVRDVGRGVGVVGGLYGRGVMVFRE